MVEPAEMAYPAILAIVGRILVLSRGVREVEEEAPNQPDQHRQHLIIAYIILFLRPLSGGPPLPSAGLYLLRLASSLLYSSRCGRICSERRVSTLPWRSFRPVQEELAEDDEAWHNGPRPAWARSLKSNLLNSSEEKQDARDGKLEGNEVERERKTAKSGVKTDCDLHRTRLSLAVSLQTEIPPLPADVNGSGVFEELRYEADVLGPSTGGTRLVDGPMHCRNPDLWATILAFRYRLDGNNGVRKVFQGMRQRKAYPALEGREAEASWEMLSVACAENVKVMRRLVRHAAILFHETGFWYRPMYMHVMRHCLQHDVARVASWHANFVFSFGQLSADTLKDLAVFAVNCSNHQDALRGVQKIYELTDCLHLYDTIIPTLWSKGYTDLALQWHKYLVTRNDRPGLPLVQSAMVKYLERWSESSMPKEHTVASSVSSEQPQDPPAHGHPPALQFNRETMYGLVGHVHGIKRKEISDSFCARLFATSAFSLELVTSGLNVFGVEAIGPLALRELVARTESSAELLDKIKILKKAGIEIRRSVFSQVVMRLAEGRQWELLQQIVGSDQHPETYEDLELQKKLLHSFVASGDWKKVNITLIVLTVSNADPDSNAWNMLLQAQCQTSDSLVIHQTLSEMRDRNIAIKDETLTALRRYNLSWRKPGHKPDSRNSISPLAELRFVSNVYLTVLQSGKPLRPERWREILKRFGMLGQLEELEKLCLWLALWYSPETRAATKVKLLSERIYDAETASVCVSPTVPRSVPASDPSQPLRQIFTPALQRALVAWGFKSAFPSSNASRGRTVVLTDLSDPLNPVTVPCEPWARGLHLLQLLESRGVLVQTTTVRRVVKHRLWTLFGPVPSTFRHSQIAQRENKYSLGHYVRYAERMWGGTLFGLDQQLLETHSLHHKRNLMFALFGSRRLVNRRRRIWARIERPAET
ncbi:hypothetical protein LTR66_008301 [Elasticomyces elasticus]|nr:hypothetical protein LTR66_008301 [Elasticomyces elasticus]